MADIGIVIVTYNSRAEIVACLDAAARSGAEVVVVDNASSDDTVDEVRRHGVRLVSNPTNRGFAAAVNQGFAALTTPYVLLLNPDAKLLGGLEALCEACRLPGAAGAGGKLVDAQGHPQVGFMVRQLPTPLAVALEVLLLNRIWPNNPVNRRYRGLQLNYNMRIPVEQPAGAFLMVRRAVWQELGGFDESFFPLWFEDVDFCRRAVDAGFRIQYIPDVAASHIGGHSVTQVLASTRAWYWCASLIKYASKHFREPGYRGVCAAVVLSSIPRMVAGMILARSLAPISAYSKIVWFAGLRLVSARRPGVIKIRS